jgi:hypothetical protein
LSQHSAGLKFNSANACESLQLSSDYTIPDGRPGRADPT